MYLNDYLIKKFVEEKNISLETLENLKSISFKDKKPLLTLFMNNGLISEKELYETISEVTGIKLTSYNTFNIDDKVNTKVSLSFIVENRIIPLLRENNKLVVVIDEIRSLSHIYLLNYYFSEDYKIYLITKSNMDLLIGNITSKQKRVKANIELEKETDKDSKKNKEVDYTLDDYLNVPAIVFADNLLLEGVSNNASDIHIEPMMNTVRIRFRIDGVLLNHTTVDSKLYPALLARYKIMANLDISERRIPQDGKISKNIAGKNYDFRISTLPNVYGEKIVIRIFSTEGKQLLIDDIANNNREKKIIHQMIEAPHGIILLTGPTGSGKTTTLYAFLKELNKEGINIQTVEDPVENQINGINQLQVNPKVGLTFSKALRSILRQDPNVIMIGEIRDEETAHIAVQAAITGHLVLSTIHTNDAITTITRLIDMGVEPYLVIDSMIGSISQRLVKQLCPHCKKEHLLNRVEANLLNVKEGTKVYEPGGCAYCNNTGYLGRRAIFEILTLSESIKEKIDIKHISNEQLYNLVNKEGFVTIDKSCRELVLEGVTSFEEYLKLINLNDYDTENDEADQKTK